MTARKSLLVSALVLALGIFVATQPVYACGNCKHGDDKAACVKKCEGQCKHDGKCECKAECKEKCTADCKHDCKGECKHADKKDCSQTCQGSHARQGNSAGCPMHASLSADSSAVKAPDSTGAQK